MNFIKGTKGNDTLSGTDESDRIYGNAGSDVLDGGAGNDELDGGAGNDVLYGGAGNDALWGSSGNDELDGGAGNDDLFGRNGNDTYLFGIGSGQDTVYEYGAPYGNRDTIQLGNGIAPTDVIIVRGIHDLTIKINGTTDQLTLYDWFVSDADKIEQVKFADGTLWDVETLLANLVDLATDGDDYLAGDSGANTLRGLKGNDIYSVDHAGDEVKEKQNEGADTVETEITYKLAANVENLTLTGTAAINGSGNALNNRIGGNSADNTLNGGVGDDHLTSAGGNDILNGGVGEDFLDGGSGNDTYLFGIGSGQDSVLENDATPGNLDTIQLGNGIAPTDVIIGRGIHNLTINIKGTADQLSLSFWFLHDDYKIEQVKFADGTLWDVADLLANLVDFATDGDDYLVGDSGANTLRGLKGNDRYLVDHAGDEVKERLNEGADTVDAEITYKLAANVENLELTGSAAINGTGNALSNVIFGNGNNNILDGGAGNDTLFGGYGNDVLNGGADNDVLIGYDGNDVLDGGLGDDNLYGDTYGDYGDDVLNGGDGNDVLSGGDGNDVLDGGVGDDVLDGGFGDDTYLFGIGSGQDRVLIYDDTFFGFGNQDTIQLGNGIAPTDVTIVRGISNLTIKINGTTDQLTLSDWFTRDFDKIVQVKFADGTLWDAAVLWANHTYLATDGDDYLAGDSGANTLMGLKGNDIYLVDHAGDEVTEKMNEGADRVDAEITYKLAANVENLKLTGSAAINGTGNALNNSIEGNIADNILSGGLGEDLLEGGTGNDILNGGLGEDFLEGGTGNDILNGDAGDDVLYSEYYYPLFIDKGGKDINKLNGGLVNDILNGGTGNDMLFDGKGDDILNGGPGDDILYHSTGDDILNGGAGNDYLVTTAIGWSNDPGYGNDILNGGVGNDTLYSGDDNDILNGGAGDDELNGSSGNDILKGGAGDDIFQLTTLSTDTIKDFSIDNDTIQLDNSVFTQLAATGPLIAANFIKGAAAADTNDYVIYNKVTGELFYDADGSDPGAATQIALLGTGTTHPALTFADFIVI